MGLDRAVAIQTFDINSENDMVFPEVSWCSKLGRGGYLHSGPQEVGVYTLVCPLSCIVEDCATDNDCAC